MPLVLDPISKKKEAVNRAVNAYTMQPKPEPKPGAVSSPPTQPAPPNTEVQKEPPKENIAPPPPAKTVFDMQREQVAADRAAAEKARAAAVERAYSNRGLGDSGIMDAAKRAEAVQVSKEASARLNSISGEEAAQAQAASEAEKAREYDAGQRALDRAANKEQYTASLAQAKELAMRGLDLQASALALQEKGMAQEDARYYAGLSQAERLAMKGYSLQESAQELTRQGMNLEDARFYAGLSQAKSLAEKGYALDELRLKLTEQGMTAEDARYYAGLAHQEKMANQQNTMDIQKGILVDLMAKLPINEEYTSRIKGVLTAFGLEGAIPGDTKAMDKTARASNRIWDSIKG